MAVLNARRRLALAQAAAALVALAAPPARAASPVERAVKAAYLYKFAAYVDWPRSSFRNPDSPFSIGVAGDDLLADELQRAVRGRMADGRPVAVRRVDRSDPLDGVHILYITGSDAFVAAVLARVRGRPVLTVTDTAGAFQQAGMIRFVEIDGRLRFEVALPEAHAAQLHISARMLAAARRVQTVSAS